MSIAPDPTTTVGRDTELDALTRRLVAAQAGRGGALLLTGEAGIGKSRLLAEAGRRAAARGMTVPCGRSVPGGGAFRPVVEALAPLTPPALAADPRLAGLPLGARAAAARLADTRPIRGPVGGPGGAAR